MLLYRCLNFLLALAVLGAPAMAAAQSATIYGSLGNFDVVNNTGDDAYGFEVELEGLSEADVYYSFSAQRYGSPRIVPYAGGVRVRWESAYDASSGQYSQRTLAHAPNTPFAGSCYQWNPATYPTSGCEHFGVSLRANATRTTSRWLRADATSPGALAPVDPPMAIAAPSYAVLPAAQPGDPPEIEVEVEAPEPAEAPELHGNAQWMKVFVRQVSFEVQLDDLVSDDALVPQGETEIEVEWDIIQAEPASGSNGNPGRSRKRGGSTLKPGTRSIVRRYELYDYVGAYDPITHEALCADPGCSAPQAGELGDFISAQMTAVNVQADSVGVSRVGNGNVESDDRRIDCGSKCDAFYDADAVVTLTARPGSNTAFTGWGGACSGNAPTCTVSVNGHVSVWAAFGTGSGGGPAGCGLVGVEGLLPFGFLLARRWRRRD